MAHPSPGYPGQNLDLVRSSAAVYQLETGVTARDIAAVLFRRKRIILFLFGSILAGAVLGATWLRPYLFPPRYLSGLKFILKKDRFDAVVTPADRAVPGLTTTVNAQEIHSEIELLKSEDVLERLAREGRVPVARLRRDLVAEPVVAGRNLTNLIAVRYSSADRAEVTRVLEALPEIYLEEYLRVNRRPAALEYFRSQAQEFEQQLRQAEAELAEFHKGQPALGAEGHQREVRQKLVNLERQRLEIDTAIRDDESRVLELTRQLGSLPPTIPAVQAVEEPAYLQRLKTQLLELENRRAQATFYREIERLDRRIREARQAIAAEAQAARPPESAPHPLRVSVESELLRSRALLAGLRARRAGLTEQERTCREEAAASRLIAAQSAGVMADLVRNVKTAEENFLLYRKKYAEAQEAENLDRKRVLNVSLAEGPRAPARADKRNLWFYLAVGFLLAAAVGSAGGFAAEMLDHSVHTPRQLERCSAMAVLATIPESRAQ